MRGLFETGVRIPLGSPNQDNSLLLSNLHLKYQRKLQPSENGFLGSSVETHFWIEMAIHAERMTLGRVAKMRLWREKLSGKKTFIPCQHGYSSTNEAQS